MSSGTSHKLLTLVRLTLRKVYLTFEKIRENKENKE
jgi:hypothetical protein